MSYRGDCEQVVHVRGVFKVLCDVDVRHQPALMLGIELLQRPGAEECAILGLARWERPELRHSGRGPPNRVVHGRLCGGMPERRGSSESRTSKVRMRRGSGSLSWRCWRHQRPLMGAERLAAKIQAEVTLVADDVGCAEEKLEEKRWANELPIPLGI